MPGVVSITTAALSTRLSTLANAKLELNVTATTDDAYIGQLLDRASGVTARWCGWVLGVQTITETFRFGYSSYVGPALQSVAPYGTPLNVQFRPLVLSFAPVTTPTAQAAIGISSITENGGTALVEGTDFEVEYKAGLVWRLRNGIRSWWNIPTVVVVYQAGYQLPNDSPIAGVVPLPADVEDVVLSLVTAGYTSRGADPRIQLALTEGVGRIAYQRTGGIGSMFIDDDLKEVLSPYRVRTF